MVGGTWRLLINDGNHNHDFPAYNVGRSIISRLTMDEKNKTKEMTRAHVTPSQILVSIKNENKENLTRVKQIYNFRHKIRNEEMNGRSVMQQTLKYLNDESYFYWYRATPEIVGCVPTGKNFVVGFAFLQDEKRESFKWALQCVRALFDPDHMPEVIVTDKEYALIHAIDDVFPKSHHMLCIRHIAKNVEARAKLDTRSALFASGFLRYWNKIVYAETEAEYEANVMQLKKKFASHPKTLQYVEDTWLIHSKKFVQAYTKKMFHLGNRTTNRVESAHNVLKRFLKTSTGSLDTIWKSFVRSENIDLHITVLHLLSQLRGKVSHLAIRKINEEYGRHKVGTDPATFGCYLRTLHGLPCAHEMRLLDGEGKSIDLNGVHIFWRTLHMEGFSTSNTPIGPYSQYQDDDEILKSYFENMKNQAPEAKKQYIFQLEKIIHPESVPLEEPVPNRATQQPSSSNKRKSRSTKNPTREDLIPAEIPVHLVPFIYEYKNVGADCNCGYRLVAHQIYGSEDQWRRLDHSKNGDKKWKLEFILWNMIDYAF
ncbi:PKS-NRPS hybrid synthetase cheA-like [Spinacia oleracea]|uniref:PKS-NRPS hybrid synthetase cheA-like n=1 Tax=Spinacia oleracea TaxID=3562 RepID=A0ABM3QQI2_SPIOL|nr:PKS-NRPS hybrid synthetase cheA-like [Spinacia oleracea]